MNEEGTRREGQVNEEGTRQVGQLNEETEGGSGE